MYSTYYTRNNPGLWVLLTDESEESIRVINEMINYAISLNFAGNQVYDRCYIHILGYNGSVKLLRSGKLGDFESCPLRVVDKERAVNDGEGGFVKVLHRTPIWLEPYIIQQKSCLADVVDGARKFINETLEFNKDIPAPIVFNISTDCNVDSELVSAIKALKDIKVKDGSLLFVNGGVVEYKDAFFKDDGELDMLTSKVPKSADFLFRAMSYMSHWNNKNDVEFNLDWIDCSTHLSFNMLHLCSLVRLFMHTDDDFHYSEDVYENCEKYVDSIADRL